MWSGEWANFLNLFWNLFMVMLRESDGSVSYMQLHTSMETFNASLKRNRINVRKRKEARYVIPCLLHQEVAQWCGFREEELFKTNILLAVYGVDKPGQEICEVLNDCLQKRLDQVTLNHLIDTLAKNTQTRLDSADVQVGWGRWEAFQVRRLNFSRLVPSTWSLGTSWRLQLFNSEFYGSVSAATELLHTSAYAGSDAIGKV